MIGRYVEFSNLLSLVYLYRFYIILLLNRCKEVPKSAPQNFLLYFLCSFHKSNVK
jgi:hypothetical protein